MDFLEWLDKRQLASTHDLNKSRHAEKIMIRFCFILKSALFALCSERLFFFFIERKTVNLQPRKFNTTGKSWAICFEKPRIIIPLMKHVRNLDERLKAISDMTRQSA